LKYPESIQVGGHTFRITLRDSYTIKDNDDASGRENRSLEIIEICTKSSEGESCSLNRLNEIAWHEILHAISGVYGAKLCEEQTEQVSQGLLQVFNQLGIQLIKE
jgi:hypothetical protein